MKWTRLAIITIIVFLIAVTIWLTGKKPRENSTQIEFPRDSQTESSVKATRVTCSAQIAFSPHEKVIIGKPVRDLAVTPDGKQIAIAGSMEIVFVRTATMREVDRLTIGKGIKSIEFSSNGRWLVVVGWQGRPLVCDVESRRLVQNDTPWSFRLLPDGNTLAAYEDGMLRLKNFESGDQINEFLPPRGSMHTFVATPDCRYFGTMNELNRTLDLWDVRAPRQLSLKIPDGCRLVLGSPAERLIALRTDSRVEIRTVPDWQKLVEIGVNKSDSSLQFSPDGTMLAARIGKAKSTARPRIRVWEVHSGQLCCETATRKDLGPFRFSRDGRSIVTGYDDGRVLSWSLRPDDLTKDSTEDLAQWWNDLASDDSRRAYRAGWRLVDAGERAIEFLNRHRSQSSKSDLRSIRCVRILRQIGSANAQKLLRKLGQGRPECHTTQLARATCAFLSNEPIKTESLVAREKPEANVTTRKVFDEHIQSIESDYQVDFATKDLSVRDVIQRIAKRLSFEVDFGELNEHAATPLRQELIGRTLLEALELACRQIDSRPMYPTLPSTGRGRNDRQLPIEVTLRRGRRILPVAFNGPFMLEVTQVEEHRAEVIPPAPVVDSEKKDTVSPPKRAYNGTGMVKFVLRGYALSPQWIRSLREYWSYYSGIDHSNKTALTIDSISGQGIDHYDKSGGGETRCFISESSFEQMMSVSTKNMLRNIKSLRQTIFHLETMMPNRVKTITFDAPEFGKLHRAGEVLVMVDSIVRHSSGRCSMEVRMRNIPPKTHDLRIFTEHDAQPVVTQSFLSKLRNVPNAPVIGAGYYPGHKFVVSQEPNNLIVQLTECGRIRINFQLGKIPLRMSSKQPHGQAQPKFSGHDAPVSITVENIHWTGTGGGTPDAPHDAYLRIHNHSDLAVRKVRARIYHASLGSKGYFTFERQGQTDRRNGRLYEFIGPKSDRTTTVDVGQIFSIGKDKVFPEHVIFTNGVVWSADGFDSH